MARRRPEVRRYVQRQPLGVPHTSRPSHPAHRLACGCWDGDGAVSDPSSCRLGAGESPKSWYAVLASLLRDASDLTSEDWTGPDHEPGPAGGSDSELTDLVSSGELSARRAGPRLVHATGRACVA